MSFSVFSSQFAGRPAVSSPSVVHSPPIKFSGTPLPQAKADSFVRFGSGASGSMPGCLKPDEHFWALMGTTMPMQVSPEKICKGLRLDTLNPDFLKALIKAYKSDPDGHSVKRERVYGTFSSPAEDVLKSPKRSVIGIVGLAGIDSDQYQISGYQIENWRKTIKAKKDELPV